MLKPKTKMIEVTTAQDVLISNYGNQTTTSKQLDVNRNTLTSIIASDRPNVVLIDDDGEYTLLK